MKEGEDVRMGSHVKNGRRGKHGTGDRVSGNLKHKTSAFSVSFTHTIRQAEKRGKLGSRKKKVSCSIYI